MVYTWRIEGVTGQRVLFKVPQVHVHVHVKYTGSAYCTCLRSRVIQIPHISSHTQDNIP